MGFNEFNFFTTIFPILFIIIFLLVIGTFIVTAIKGINQWNKNNHSPRLTVPAKVVTKRTDMSYHTRAGNHRYRSHSTRYYVTFQVESGDRMELNLSGMDYGELAEGDQGYLTFQGTRYLEFNRANI